MFRSLDLFPIPITFNYNKKPLYQTKLGGFLSFVIIMIILLCIIYFISIFLYRRDPNVSVSNSILKEFPYRTINNNNFFVAFRLEDPDGNNIEIFDKYLSIYAYNSNIKNGNYSSDMLEIQTCDKVWNKDNKFRKLFNKYNLNSLYCLNLTDSELNGYITEYEYSYINIRFSICDNISSSLCAKKEEIYKFYELTLVHIFLYNNIIDSTSNDNPISNSIHNIYNFFDFRIYKQLDIFYKNITFTSDQGIFFPYVTDMTDIIFDSFEKLFGLRDEIILSDSIYDINIYLKNNYVVYNRIYKRIYDVFASLGGIIQFFRLIGKYLIYSFNLKIFELDLCNNFHKFNLHDDIKEYKKQFTIEQSFNKRSKRKDDSMRINLMINETILKSNDLDQKVNKYVEIMKTNKIKKKIIYSNYNIFKSVFCSNRFYGKNLILLEKFYRYSINDIYKYLDISNIVRMSKELLLLKDILLTDGQKMALMFIDKSELNKNNIDKKESSIEEILKVVMPYILKNKVINKLKKIDNKIIECLDDDLKKLIYE